MGTNHNRAGHRPLHHPSTMNKRTAIRRHKKRLANLTEEQVRNLMEHAANKTPLLRVEEMPTCYVNEIGKCCPARLAGSSSLPGTKDHTPDSSIDALERLGGMDEDNNYYEEMIAIGSHTALRRLWIDEGKRRGFELVDA